MASPRIVVFAIFDATTKAPKTGVTPTFVWYTDEAGGSLTAPAITEIGGGLYKFTPTLQANHAILYMLDCGSTADDRYPYDMIRAEDFDLDLVAGLAATSSANGTAIGNVQTAVNGNTTALAGVTSTLAGLAGAVWEELRSNHHGLNTMGDLMRLVWLVFTGHVKIAAGVLTVYAEDGSTVFQTQTLKNATGAAGGLDTTERLAATRP